MFLPVVGSYCAKFETDQTFSYVHWRKKNPTISGVVDLTNMWWSTFKSVWHRFASLQLVCRLRVVACRLFSRGVIFTRARIFLALLSLRKNGGLLVAYSCVNRSCILHGFRAGANAILYRGVDWEILKTFHAYFWKLFGRIRGMADFYIYPFFLT